MTFDQRPKSRTAYEIAGDLALTGKGLNTEAARCICDLIEMISAYQDVCVAYRTGRQTRKTERALDLIQRYKWRVEKRAVSE
jgi:hypothetical protein